jgi:manganese/zinc/iron transport system permease protein
MNDLARLLLLQDANTRTVLVGVGLLGLVCGVIGAFAVLRRRALVGDAVAHAALPGICLAYLITGDRSFWMLLAGALVSGIAGVWCINAIRGATRVREDAAIGLVLATFFGLGVALSGWIQKQPGGNRAGLDSFILGKAVGMVRQDAIAIGAVALGVLAAVLILYKELRLLCFDREYAASIGRPVVLLDLILMTLISVCTVAGLPAVGVVLTAALLIIPGTAARFWTERLGLMLTLAGVFGVIAGVGGVAASAVVTLPGGAGLPTGPMVVLTAAALFIASALFAPSRGIIAGAIRRGSLRRELARIRAKGDAA